MRKISTIRSATDLRNCFRGLFRRLATLAVILAGLARPSSAQLIISGGALGLDSAPTNSSILEEEVESSEAPLPVYWFGRGGSLVGMSQEIGIYLSLIHI